MQEIANVYARALFEAAACIAFPSITEGFGLPPLEAMSVGCPAVVAPNGALPEVCGDAAIYADAEDPGAWAAAIAAIVAAPERRRVLGAVAWLQAAKFPWSASAAKLLQVIRDASR